MFRTLTVKLSLAFLLISVIGAVLSALIARQTTLTEFDRLVLDRSRSSFIEILSDYYQESGSWDGIQEHLSSIYMMRDSRDEPKIFDEPFSWKLDNDNDTQSTPDEINSVDNDKNDKTSPNDDKRYSPPSLFALVDMKGIVLTSAPPYFAGDHIDPAMLSEGVSIEIDGRVVGTVLTTDNLPTLDPRDVKYLQRTNTSSLYAAAIAAVIALLVGIVLASTLTSPLRALTNAISGVARGELNQKVTVNSRDELGELADAFNRMSADLAHANHLRRQMTADIAHDLRSPLTVISGYIESMRDGILDPDAERLDIINDEVIHLQRLVDDLRTLSLADANELTLNCQSLATGEFIERTALTYQHQAKQQNISIKTSFETPLPNIEVDSERMMQVLGNLIDNSLRHTPSGGTITLSARLYRQIPQSIQITVEDNGEGIPPDALPNIFERFYRADRSRHRNEGESGLGLAIARSIVEAHHGTISVKSIVNQGTTFSIILPVK